MYQSALIVYTQLEYERNLVEIKLKDLACDLQQRGYYITFTTRNIGNIDDEVL